MNAGDGREAPGETALRPRGRRGTATLVVRTAAIAALAGLAGGLVVGWWAGRQAPEHPVVALAPAAAPLPSQPASLAPAPSAIARAAPTILKRRVSHRTPRPRVGFLPPQRGPIT